MLVANHTRKIYEAKEPVMVQYLQRVMDLLGSFATYEIHHMPISKNKKADALSKLASIHFSYLAKYIKVLKVAKPSILVEEVNGIEPTGWTWMTQLLNYF